MPWSTFALPPNSDGDPAVVSDGQYLYAIGGWPGDVPLPDVYRYDFGSNTWIPRAPLPDGRWAGAAAYAAGKIYYLGGQDVNDNTATVFTYDPANDAAGWTTLHPLPSAISQFSAAGANGRVYYTPPFTGVTTFVYNPASDAAGFTAIAGRPVPTSNGSLVGFGTRLYFLGGFDDTHPNGFATVYSYDQSANTWAAVSAMPAASFDTAAGFAADGRLWTTTRNSYSASSYDPANDAAGWQAEADLPAKSFGGYLNRAGTFMAYFNGQFGSAYDISLAPPGVLYPATVLGATRVLAAITVTALPAARYLAPAVVRGRTVVTIPAATALDLDLVYSQNTTAIDLSLRGVFALDPVIGSTTVRILGDVDLNPDVVLSRTDVAIRAVNNTRVLTPDLVSGASLVRIISFPLLQANTSIVLAFSARMQVELTDSIPADDSDDLLVDDSVDESSDGPVINPELALPAGIRRQPRRTIAGVVLSLPEPAISDGKPSLPRYWAGHRADGSDSGISADARLIQGPLHIHAIADPNPVWDPATGGWTTPPPDSGVGDCRWTVDSLPDPRNHRNGWYWLGEPTSQDGTAGIESGARQWAPAGGSSGPTWHSFFPFKPSVNAYNAPIVGEHQVHHPKGVHFNSHYIEHMWADFGANQHQPFTWIVVATVMSDSFPGYQHNILDAGRNPDDLGFPRISASSCSTERRLGDRLPYRTEVSWTGSTALMRTATGNAPLRTRGAAGYHPRMFVSIFDGAKSQLGVWDPFHRLMTTGKVAGGPAYSHRYMVMGREQGWLSQRHACNLMVFEIRYWRHALVHRDLDAQYKQLSSTHQFDAYRQL